MITDSKNQVDAADTPADARVLSCFFLLSFCNESGLMNQEQRTKTRRTEHPGAGFS